MGLAYFTIREKSNAIFRSISEQEFLHHGPLERFVQFGESMSADERTRGSSAVFFFLRIHITPSFIMHMIAPLQKAWQWWGGLRLRLVAAQTRSSWKLRNRS
jgi:hypothetical protein